MRSPDDADTPAALPARADRLMQRYDVAVIGGGVAGSATALALKQREPDLSVALVERTAYGQPRIGETLPPHTVALWQQLGLWERFTAQGFLPAYGTCAAWGSDELHHNEFLFTPFGHGWHVDRQVFDAWLAQEARRQGVELLTGTQMVSPQWRDHHWTFTLQQAAGLMPGQSRVIVDATGRLAVFARQQGACKLVHDQLVGIFRFFKLHTPLADTRALIEAQEHGWWYSAAVPGQRVVVAFMTDADIARQHGLNTQRPWSQWLEQTHHTRQRLAHAMAGTPPAITAAHSQRLHPASGPAWLAVGDAASTYDPLSSLGIFKALRTGIVASYAISDYCKQRDQAFAKYEKLVAMDYEAYLTIRATYYQQEHRFSHAVFWQRRSQGMDEPE